MRVLNVFEKVEIVRGYVFYVVVGNGNNDVVMLEGVEFIFCVIGKEGVIVDVFLVSDVVVIDVRDVIVMFFDEKKFIVMLRG